LSLHGSNRNNETQVCVICHNPNATDISVRPGAPATGVDGKVEEAIDFKYMIHAIHAGALDEEGFRENGIVVYGFRGSVNDFSEVWLPSGTDSLKDCTRCHISAPAVPISTAALPTTVLTGSDLSSPADDENITPTAAVCSSCHDTELAAAHMQQNGAVFDLMDGTSYTETCSLCHAAGGIEDVAVAHAAETFTLIGTITAPTEGGGSGGSSQVALCGPGPVSSQPAGHTDRVDCCSCHGFN
jgi:OmcA/MtrC family decaheme c-type cytochrome